MLFHPEVFWFGFSQGFVVGPITLYGIREGLDPTRGSKYQIQVIAGAAVVDFLYLIISTFGAAKLIQNPIVQGLLWIGAAYMLIHMSLNSYHERPHRMSFKYMHRQKKHFYEQDFTKAIALNLVNPMSIVFWVVVAGSMYADYQGVMNPLWFSLNILIAGIAASGVIAILTSLVRKTFKPWMLKKLTQAGSLVLMGYGLFFTWKAAMQLPDLVLGLVHLF